MPKDSPQRNRRGGAAATDPRASARDDGTPLHIARVSEASRRLLASDLLLRARVADARTQGYSLRQIAEAAERSPEWVRQTLKR